MSEPKNLENAKSLLATIAAQGPNEQAAAPIMDDEGTVAMEKALENQDQENTQKQEMFNPNLMEHDLKERVHDKPSSAVLGIEGTISSLLQPTFTMTSLIALAVLAFEKLDQGIFQLQDFCVENGLLNEGAGCLMWGTIV